VRREVDDEPGTAERPGAEAAEAKIAAMRGHQRRQTERPQGPRDLSRSTTHATTTEQTAVWLPTET
jgi:hypothetical protein